MDPMRMYRYMVEQAKSYSPTPYSRPTSVIVEYYSIPTFLIPMSTLSAHFSISTGQVKKIWGFLKREGLMVTLLDERNRPFVHYFPRERVCTPFYPVDSDRRRGFCVPERLPEMVLFTRKPDGDPLSCDAVAVFLAFLRYVFMADDGKSYLVVGKLADFIEALRTPEKRFRMALDELIEAEILSEQVDTWNPDITILRSDSISLPLQF